MKERIFKYQVGITDYQEIVLPVGSKIISAMNQRESMVIYAIVDSELDILDGHDTYSIYIRGTGHPLDGINPKAKFLGSVSFAGGSLVFHVFVRRKE